MMIRFWREIAVVALFVAAAAFFGLWRYEVLDHKQTSDDLAVANNAIEQHQKNVLITERANNEYQTDIDRLNADIKRLRKRPAKCVTIAEPSGVRSGSGSGREHGRENGISSEWLYEYAVEAEGYRLQRNHCKKFVNDVWGRE